MFFGLEFKLFCYILQLRTMFVHHVDMFETSIPCLFVDDRFAIFTSSSFLNHAWSFGSCYELSFSTHIFNLPLHVISSSPWHNVMNWDLSRIFLTMFWVVCNHLSRHPCFPLLLHVLAWIPTHFKSRRGNVGGNKMDKGEHDSQGDIINIEAYFIAHKAQS